jgi:hypothetical protein
MRARLAPGGAVFVNIILENDSDETATDIVDVMSDIFAEVRLLDTPGVRDRNAIVMAGAVGHLAAPKLILRPQGSVSRIEADMAHMEFRTRRGTLWRLFFG